MVADPAPSETYGGCVVGVGEGGGDWMTVPEEIVSFERSWRDSVPGESGGLTAPGDSGDHSAPWRL